MRRSDGVKVDGLDVLEELGRMKGTDDITSEEATERVARDREPSDFPLARGFNVSDSFADLLSINNSPQRTWNTGIFCYQDDIPLTLSFQHPSLSHHR